MSNSFNWLDILFYLLYLQKHYLQLLYVGKYDKNEGNMSGIIKSLKSTFVIRLSPSSSVLSWWRVTLHAAEHMTMVCTVF